MDDGPGKISLKRGPKSQRTVRVAPVVGRKYVRLLQQFLGDLRQQYHHPNRVLFYDDVVTAYLLAFFNTSIRSLRTLEDASQVPGVRQHLSVQAVCKSTLSDANRLFDPALLEGLIARLRRDLPDLERHHPELHELLDKVTLVDGSFFRLAGDVAWAFQQKRLSDKPLGTLRLNCQYSLKTGVPSGITISGDDGVGEAAVAIENVEPGQVYLFDSGIMSFDHLNAILGAGSHFLCPIREHVNFENQSATPLSDRDISAGVTSDTVGRLPGSKGSDTPPEVILREVKVAYLDRQGKPRILRLLTDLVDLPAHLIAALYRYRWQIELFFRWLKVSANFEHLTSHSKNGVTLGFHIALIACLLTALYTQRGVSKYSHMLLGFVAAGQADLEDILPILANRERERERDRKRQKARKAAQKNA